MSISPVVGWLSASIGCNPCRYRGSYSLWSYHLREERSWSYVGLITSKRLLVVCFTWSTWLLILKIVLNDRCLVALAVSLTVFVNFPASWQSLGSPLRNIFQNNPSWHSFLSLPKSLPSNPCRTCPFPSWPSSSPPFLSSWESSWRWSIHFL